MGFSLQATLAQESELSVEKIMQDPTWIGIFPSDIEWGENSENIYFKYNLQEDPADSLYRINIKGNDDIKKVSWREQDQLIPTNGTHNDARTKKLYARDGTLFLYDLKRRQEKELLELGERISGPQFLNDENLVSFTLDNNAYVYNIQSGSLKKLTKIKSGKEREQKEESLSDKDQWLEKENLGLLEVVRERTEKEESSKAYREMARLPEDFTFYTGNKGVSGITVSPNLKYVTFNLITRADGERTDVPDYVDASGYTVNLPARSKVGGNQTAIELAVYNLEKDTVYMVKT